MATASAPGAAPAVATDSARLVVDMKRELMDMVRAAQYESALAVCERRASRGVSRGGAAEGGLVS